MVLKADGTSAKPSELSAMEHPRRGAFYVINTSKRCEPSAFLFTKAVGFFVENGYRMTEDIEDSDVILVNTCCVTLEKTAASKAALDFSTARGRGKQVVLFGCMAGISPTELDREELIRIGPKNLGELDAHFPHHTSVNAVLAGQLSSAFYTPGQGLDYSDYFIMIAQGCCNQCSYCNIKRAKGEVRSESAEAVLRQLRNGLSLGMQNFVLLADDCASYGRDLGTDLVHLLRRMLAAGSGFALKLSYLYPQFLLEHLNELRPVFTTGRIRYVNVPIQSGSQRILDLMNRRYDIGATVEAVERIRAVAPETTLCTHIMINFPTESDDDFLKSLAVADVFDEVIFLHYSDNWDTAAEALLPKVTEPVVKSRLEIASDYANRCKPGRSAVIKDFNCDTPYNIPGAEKR